MSYGVTVCIIISDSIIIANGHCVGVESTLLMPRARLIHFAGELPLFSLLSLWHHYALHSLPPWTVTVQQCNIYFTKYQHRFSCTCSWSPVTCTGAKLSLSENYQYFFYRIALLVSPCPQSTMSLSSDINNQEILTRKYFIDVHQSHWSKE